MCCALSPPHLWSAAYVGARYIVPARRFAIGSLLPAVIPPARHRREQREGSLFLFRESDIHVCPELRFSAKASPLRHPDRSGPTFSSALNYGASGRGVEGSLLLFRGSELQLRHASAQNNNLPKISFSDDFNRPERRLRRIKNPKTRPPAPSSGYLGHSVEYSSAPQSAL